MSWDLAVAEHAATPAIDDEALEAAWDLRPAPGKVTRTERLRPRRARARAVDAPRAVQADSGALFGDDPFALHEAARAGVTGGGQALPHLAAVQAAFGRHDLRGVRAHIGGAAAAAARAIGAAAYATGEDIAFADTPALRQVAHEAAHVVQQRAGVALADGIGQLGDRYEQHADAVADRVERGESAEALLDAIAGSGARAPAIQREVWNHEATDAIATLTAHTTERTGLTIAGSPIFYRRSQYVVDHGGRHYEIRISGRHIGLLYGGDAGATETAFDEIIATPGLYDDGQLPVARALRPHIRSEGAVDSINTWDSMGLTLAGRARTEAPELLRRAARLAATHRGNAAALERGATIADALIPGTRANRFDFTQIEALIEILRANRRALVAAKIEDGMLRFFEGHSAPGRGAGDIDATARAGVARDTASGELDEVVITIAVHLNLGGSDRFGDPIGAARQAMARYPVDPALQPRDFANLSRQVAHLIKLRAEAWADDNPVVEEYPGTWMYQKTQDFNRHFEHALRDQPTTWGASHARDVDGHPVPPPRAGADPRPEQVHNFFDIAAAHDVIPCWTAISSLSGERTRPARGRVWLQVSPESIRAETHRGRYYDFGEPTR